MKKIKLFETLGSILDLKLLESEDKLVHLEGTFGVCGVMNNNSRIYTKENYSEMIESLQDKIKSHSLLGELEHSSSLSLKLDNVSHRIDALSIDEDGVVHGEITLLDTPKGKIAKAIIEAGSPLYVSSKAVGSIDENNVVTLTKLFGYDLVGSPGFDQARVDLKSNEKLESFNESTYGVIELSEDDEKEDDNKDIKDDEENPSEAENLELESGENLSHKKDKVANVSKDAYAVISKNKSHWGNDIYIFSNDPKYIKEQFEITSESGENIDITKKMFAVCAINGLMNYIEETQKQIPENLNKITFYEVTKYMTLDINARRNLEITERMRDKSKRGTLLWVLDTTSTAMRRKTFKKMGK